MSISDFSLKNKPVVFALIAIITIFGLTSYNNLPRESSPDIQIPMVIVTTLYFGTSAQDMESLVTAKLEQELSDIDNIKEISSFSGEGVSNITVEFDPDEDVDDVMAKVREKVDLAKPELPSDAEDPMLSEINFSSFPIILVNISGQYSLVKLKDIAEDLQDEIEQIPGILEVSLTGGLEREVQVNVDPEKLRHYRVGLLDVQNAIRNENINIPGGNVNIGKYSYLLRIPGEIETPDEIENFIVKADDHYPVYIKDVAEVVYGFKDVGSTARQDLQNCITLSVSKRSGENIIDIADETKRIVKEALPSLPSTTQITFTSDQSKDIRMMVGELENGILTGLVLVILVLFFALGFRTSLFVAISIPLSMMLSFIVIEALGYTLNMVVLFSLILALGMLVDNAIVIVENIYRFMEEGDKPLTAAAKGVNEVAWAVTASTATTLCAFGPMILWPGIMGEFMKYLPITLIITLTSSLIVALIINPTVCAVFMKLKFSKKKTKPGVADKIIKNYKIVLEWALDHRIIVLSSSFAFLLFAMVLNGVFGTGIEFFPSVDPQKVYANFELPSGSRIATTDSLLKRLENKLGEWDNVKTFVAQSGVSLSNFDFSSGGNGPSNKGRISIDMIDRQERKRNSNVTLDEIRESVKDYSGAIITVVEEEGGPPTGAPVTIEISGPGIDTLGALSERIQHRIENIRGIVNLQSDYDGAKPEVRVNINRDKAAYLGVNTAMIGSLIRTAINGSETGYFRDGTDEYDITVRLNKDKRSSIENIEDLQFVIDEGDMVPLSSVADVEVTTGLGGIRRKDQDRLITITSDVQGRLAPEALAEVQDTLAKLDLPMGYFLNYAGEDEEQQKAEDFLSKAFVIAIFSITLVLLLQFRSFITPIVIISSVVLSLVGVFLGLTITRMPFGVVMTGVGVISLAGVVVNNAIVLLDYTLKLRDRGLSKRDAIVRAGVVRLRPVTLTAVTTILGLLPMATGVTFDFRNLELVIGSDASQWWGGMAVAVIFGLLFATILTLVVVPVMYSLADGFSVKMKSFWGKFNLVNMD